MIGIFLNDKKFVIFKQLYSNTSKLLYVTNKPPSGIISLQLCMPEKQPTILSFISPFGTNFWKFKCLYGDSVCQLLRVLYGEMS